MSKEIAYLDRLSTYLVQTFENDYPDKSMYDVLLTLKWGNLGITKITDFTRFNPS